jgi:hypothetical protein
MVHFGSKGAMWGLEGVIPWKGYIEKEDAALIRTIFRSTNSGVPVK